MQLGSMHTGKEALRRCYLDELVEENELRPRAIAVATEAMATPAVARQAVKKRMRAPIAEMVTEEAALCFWRDSVGTKDVQHYVAQQLASLSRPRS